MLSIRGLRFSYGSAVLFDELSLTVPSGSITALVGANGAGKSTLMNCITGRLRPAGGEMTLENLSLAKHINTIRRTIGYLPDEYGLFASLSARQHLQYAASAHQMPDSAAAVNTAAERTQLQTLLDKTPAEMSRGQRQRLAIAMTLVHRPRFILLDEPASGLDPSARYALSKLFLSLREDGATLLVSSHILTELRDYATHCIIMDKGKIIHSGGLTDSNRWRITLATARPDAAETAMRLLTSLPQVSKPKSDGDCIYFDLPQESDSSALLAELVAAQVPVSEYTRVATDIERIYNQAVSTAPAEH